VAMRERKNLPKFQWDLQNVDHALTKTGAA